LKQINEKYLRPASHRVDQGLPNLGYI